jgi:hypothetical protein
MRELSKNQIYDEVSKVWKSPVGAVTNTISKLSENGVKVIVKGTNDVAKLPKRQYRI